MIGTLRKLQKLISKFPSEARAPPSPPSKVPAKPGLPTALQYSTSEARAPHSPQHSTSKARAPHSPPAQYQQSQGSPQPPSTVPAKPGLPIAPSTVPVKPGLPTAPSTVPVKPGLPIAPQHNTSKARAPHSPPAQYQQSQGFPQPPSTVPASRDHHRDCLPLSSARRSSQPPGTITGTACLSPVPEEALSHQGPSQGLSASPQHQKKLPPTRDHHRACLSSVNIHWIFIHSNWKHHD